MLRAWLNRSPSEDRGPNQAASRPHFLRAFQNTSHVTPWFAGLRHHRRAASVQAQPGGQRPSLRIPRLLWRATRCSTTIQYGRKCTLMVISMADRYAGPVTPVGSGSCTRYLMVARARCSRAESRRAVCASHPRSLVPFTAHRRFFRGMLIPWDRGTKDVRVS